MTSFVRFVVGLVLAGCMHAGQAQSTLRPEVEAFITEMSAKHGFSDSRLRALFARVAPRPGILRAMSAPSTSRPWHEFRPRYVEPRRIEAGVRFWNENAATLAKARAQFGVPEEIIVATIGIETLYGRQIGTVKVLEALATLAFHYPRRADFFRGELEAFLVLAREQGWDPAAVRGSYAGAMGLPQFMPSSYRKFALDFDEDGARNLWSAAADAIGSVANYYRTFGWQDGAATAVPAAVDPTASGTLDTSEILPQRTVAEYAQAGATPLADVPGDAKAALIRLETEAGPEYWLGLQNFYVITRYNRSVNYAMAVFELSRAIRERMNGATVLGER